MHSECGGSGLGRGCGGNIADREAMVREKLKEQDDRERIATTDARGLTLALLTEKGFSEIEEDPSFDVSTPGTTARVSTDFIVRMDGRPFLAVKCSMALDSRQRHVLAFARAATPDIIPFAVITDGLKAHLMETISGRLISEGAKEIPGIEMASGMLAALPAQSLSEERLRRERMVLLAFESASCPPVL